MPAPRSHPEEITIGIAPAVRRGRDAKLLGIFVLAAIPPAAILWFVLSPLAAALYVVAQTLFLWFGLRRRHSPLLRLSPDGLSSTGPMSTRWGRSTTPTGASRPFS
jgi:hypothetical protein